MTEITILYRPDLTLLDPPAIKVGVLMVEGDQFTRFRWCLDWGNMGLDRSTTQQFKSLPHLLQRRCLQWASIRDRKAPKWRKDLDPKTLVDFLRYIYSRSSLSIGAVEHQTEPV